MLLRKEQAGSDSFGHVWETDGAVVEVPEEEARQLLRIADAGFSEVAEVPVTQRVPKQPVKLISESPKPLKAKTVATKGIDVSTFTE